MTVASAVTDQGVGVSGSRVARFWTWPVELRLSLDADSALRPKFGPPIGGGGGAVSGLPRLRPTVSTLEYILINGINKDIKNT